MLFNALALALQFGLNIFTSPEDHRPLSSMAICAFGFVLLDPTPSQPILGWSPLRVLQCFLPTGIYASLLGASDDDSGERALEHHTHFSH